MATIPPVLSVDDSERIGESLGDGDSRGTVPPAMPEADNDRVRARLWWSARLLYRRRWWIVLAGIVAAVGSVLYALQLPNQYRAETRVLVPEGGSGLAAGLLSSISPSAASLFGGGGGFSRYLAILTSRETLGSAVDRFGLVRVYELDEEPDPRAAAIDELLARSLLEVSLDYDYLSVSVLDPSPERAAQISTFLVERLNERNIELTSSAAAENTELLRTRLSQANLALDSAQAELQALQERYGVIEPEAQASALMSTLAASQAQAAMAEAQYQALLSQFGPENPDVIGAREALESLRGQVSRLESGGEAVMPVPLSTIPRVQRQYAQAMQEIETQARIIQEVQPLYEQSALRQRQQSSAVQVLDTATPPARKAEPRRSILVVATTLGATLLFVALLLLVAVARRVAPSLTAQLRA